MFKVTLLCFLILSDILHWDCVAPCSYVLPQDAAISVGRELNFESDYFFQSNMLLWSHSSCWVFHDKYISFVNLFPDVDFFVAGIATLVGTLRSKTMIGEQSCEPDAWLLVLHISYNIWGLVNFIDYTGRY